MRNFEEDAPILKRVRELLFYDNKDACLRNKITRNNKALAGARAGCVFTANNGKSYIVVMVDGKLYYAHRLIWLMMTGAFPESEIDHIDGSGLNNRINNLRDVTPTENKRNTRKHVNNTSGFTGVYWHKIHQKWCAYITLNGKHKHIGYFATLEAAAAARTAASVKYRFHQNHGATRPL